MKEKKEEKVAIVLGTFDLTHYGHFWKFRELKRRGFDRCVAGVTSDEFAEEYKRKPVLSQKERMDTLMCCKWVDMVIELNKPYDHTDEVFASCATHVVRGEDWTEEGYTKQTGLSPEWLEENGIEMVIISRTEGISTSEIIKRLKE